MDTTTMADIMDTLADCGHRYGSLRFYGNPTHGGVECPTCGTRYPWGTPLVFTLAGCRAEVRAWLNEEQDCQRSNFERRAQKGA